MQREASPRMASAVRERFTSASRLAMRSSIPAMKSGMTKIKENLINVDIQAIFSTELIKELLSSEEFKLISNYLELYNLKFKNIDVRVTDEDFSNFNLTDSELIQPSFDPTNKLIGAYISRNANIYQVFYEKFNELYEKGIPLALFLKEQKEIKDESYSKTQFFGLCLL